MRMPSLRRYLQTLVEGSNLMEAFETINSDFDAKDSSKTFEIHLKMPGLDEKKQHPMQYDFREKKLTLTG